MSLAVKHPVVLPPLEGDELERQRQLDRAFLRNQTYFIEHHEELLERYPDCRHFVIEDAGGRVTAFDQALKLFDFLDDMVPARRRVSFDVSYPPPGVFTLPG